MALIPVQFINSGTNIATSPTAAAVTLSVTAGTQLVAFGWGEGAGSSSGVGTISDTQSNVWTQILDTGLIPGGAPGFSGPWRGSIWWTTCLATGNVTVSVPGASTSNARLALDNYRNLGAVVGSQPFTSGSAAGSFSGPNQAAPGNNTLYWNFWRWQNAAIDTVISWTQRSTTNSPAFPTFDFLEGISGVTATVQTATNTGAGGFFGIYAQQVLFSSAAATADPNNGNVFLGTASMGMFGMTWLKNVTLLARDYWDQGLTAPYVGQIYPSPNTGGAQSGQTYPY